MRVFIKPMRGLILLMISIVLIGIAISSIYYGRLNQSVDLYYELLNERGELVYRQAEVNIVSNRYVQRLDLKVVSCVPGKYAHKEERLMIRNHWNHTITRGKSGEVSLRQL